MDYVGIPTADCKTCNRTIHLYDENMDEWHHDDPKIGSHEAIPYY
jgi:hypothetical protein